jgi:hypothetical protein
VKRGGTTARGYGKTHQQRRDHWKLHVATGTVRCGRGSNCRHAELIDGQLIGGLIQPDDAWDLGHDDHDRSRYIGPEHADCNRATRAHQPPRRREPEQHPGLL